MRKHSLSTFVCILSGNSDCCSHQKPHSSSHFHIYLRSPESSASPAAREPPLACFLPCTFTLAFSVCKKTLVLKTSCFQKVGCYTQSLLILKGAAAFSLFICFSYYLIKVKIRNKWRPAPKTCCPDKLSLVLQIARSKESRLHQLDIQ